MQLINLALAFCALGVSVAHPSRHNHARLHDREVTSQPMHVHPQHNHSSIATTPLTPPASTFSSTSASVKRKQHHTRSHINSHSPKRNATTILHEHTTVKHVRPTAVHNGTTTAGSPGHAHHHHHSHHEHQHHHNATVSAGPHHTNSPRDLSPNTLIKSHSTTTPLTTTLIITNKHTPTPKGKPQSTTTIVITPISSATSLQSLYGQCYGSYYTGPTACVAGATCQINGPWWGQCASATSMPVATSAMNSSSAVITTSESAPTLSSSGSSKTKTTKSKTMKTKTKTAASQTVSMMIAAPVSAAQADETMTIGL